MKIERIENHLQVKVNGYPDHEMADNIADAVKILLVSKELNKLFKERDGNVMVRLEFQDFCLIEKYCAGYGVEVEDHLSDLVDGLEDHLRGLDHTGTEIKGRFGYHMEVDYGGFDIWISTTPYETEEERQDHISQVMGNLRHATDGDGVIAALMGGK